MPEPEARRRAVYDHDNDEPRAAGRRRQVADWGVGEEIFDHMPARRFERRPRRDIPRGDAHDGRRTIVIETVDREVAPERPATAEEEFATRDDALRAREAHDELWGGDEPFADHHAPTPSPDAENDDAHDILAEPGQNSARRPDGIVRGVAPQPPTQGIVRGGKAGPPTEGIVRGVEPRPPTHGIVRGGKAGPPTEGFVRGGQPGRRTVKIGGRPAEFHGPPARARQRPPRTVHERLGPRPERIAAWAFVLGLLLILIAVATANAAVLT